ncbi:MAG: ATP-binding cassette domain-containing protein [Deltaproteobacteria bacterium]|nr:ATP-binding cassette domain-containing protein [Deltaproteobacteria bacterium]MBI2974447.1 ATP-binding cassette domain-containing protein [Deltaproteobacteria bacterium]
MLRIDNIEKFYGKQVLFRDASLQVQPHERVGLVGRNGSGKSTLLQMILGETEPDEGNIIVPKGYRIGHVAQHLHFTEPTVLQEGCLGLPPDEIYDHYKVEAVLFGLGFTEKDMQLPPMNFSGGFQVRLNLAKVLVSHPNLLLLDEPTNYLDIVSIRWIIKFLKRWPHELILISHDREFMDSITTHTALIHRQKIRKLEGDTAKVYAQIAQDEEVHEKTRANEAKQREHIEAFVERFRAQASKAAIVQSRLKLLEKLPQLEELEAISDLDFAFRYSPFEAKRLMEASNLTFGYDKANLLIKDLSMSIGSKDRIAIIGKNGKGKSTLIKLLAGELLPLQGTINKHQLLKEGYFGQTNIDRLNSTATVEEEIGSANPSLGRTAVRTICGTMMFGGEAAEKKVQVLSGGERSRVMLGKIIAAPSNMLLLDEPTNHLDMQSIDAMVEALENFAGAVIIVTHSELVLRTLPTRLLVFQDDNVSWFNGTYDEFLEKVGWREENEEVVATTAAVNPKKALRQNRAAITKERSKVIKPLQDEMKRLEERIMKLEDEEAALNTGLTSATHAQMGSEIAALSKSVKKIKAEIDSCFERLETVTNEHDKLAAEFDARLAELDLPKK